MQDTEMTDYNLSSKNDSQMEIEESAEIIPKDQLNKDQYESLIKQANEYNKLLIEFEKKFSDEEETDYYIISLKWLQRWKVYVSYDQVINGKQPTPFFGGCQLSQINLDIIESNPKKKQIFNYSPNNLHYNTIIKENLICDQHYIIINNKIWNFFMNYYEGKTVIRQTYRLNNVKQVEVNLKKINVIIVSSSYLREIDSRRRDTLPSGFLLVSRFLSLSEFNKIVKNTIPEIKQFQLINRYNNNDFVRYWALNSDLKLDKFNKYIQDTTNASKSYEYKIRFDGQYINQDELYLQFDNIEMLPDDYMVIEIKENNKSWVFHNDQVQMEASCECCNKETKLNFSCICKKVFYCSEHCKNRDRPYHQNRCERAGEEEFLNLVENEKSDMGVCGLRNIGNTCFMNSGLQCLSNCYQFTQYFLEQKYKDQINIDNPLGTKGKLATAYAELVRKLWLDSSKDFAPWRFKREIGEFQSIFSGFSQHDSQELISFVIDGIHEDLNKIKIKPYVEQQDYDATKSDLLSASEFWFNFLKRNNSIVTDYFYGQYKSRLDCPECKKISITFDPFSMISLPIPQNTMKSIEIMLIMDSIQFKQKKIKFQFDKSKQHTIKNLKRDLQLSYNLNETIVYTSSQFYIEDEIVDKMDTNEVRKKCKFRMLVIKALNQVENQIQEDDELYINIAHTRCNFNTWQDETYRRNFTQIMKFRFSKQQTFQSIHLQLFQIFKDYFLELLDPIMSHQNNYEELFIKGKESDRPWKINLQTNSKGFDKCYYCNDKNCKNCCFEYTDNMKLQDLIDKIKNNRDDINNNNGQGWSFNNRGDIKIEFELFWRKVSPKFPKLEDIFENEQVEQFQENEKTSDKDNQITLKDCLNLFQLPEQLGEDNKWYCSQCKDFMQANKTISIYKASKYFIIHLKRFKDQRQSMYRQKLGVHVEYPFILELEEYIINKHFPNDYQNEINLNQNGDTKKLNYKLIGVVHHFGDLGGGHYTAHCFNQIKQKWFYYDDSNVREELNLKNIINNSGYILFYQKEE